MSITDPFDSEEFDAICYAYRSAQGHLPTEVAFRFEAIKTYCRRILAEAGKNAEPVAVMDYTVGSKVRWLMDRPPHNTPLYTAPQRSAQEQMPETARTGAAVQPESSASAAATPFDNCKFQICDLPGQCIAEGRCHHPKPVAAQSDTPTPRICPIHGDQWCSCPTDKEPTHKEIIDASQQILDAVEAGFWKDALVQWPRRFLHTDDCRVHSPHLSLCSCGLETRLKGELLRLLRENEILKRGDRTWLPMTRSIMNP